MDQITYKTQKEKVRTFNNGFLATHLINIGYKLGIFEAINNNIDGITIFELASNLKLHEPYLKI